jgi:hypothetical protein
MAKGLIGKIWAIWQFRRFWQSLHPLRFRQALPRLERTREIPVQPFVTTPIRSAFLCRPCRGFVLFLTFTQRYGFAYARLHAGLTSRRAYGAWSVAI